MEIAVPATLRAVAALLNTGKDSSITTLCRNLNIAFQKFHFFKLEVNVRLK